MIERDISDVTEVKLDTTIGELESIVSDIEHGHIVAIVDVVAPIEGAIELLNCLRKAT